MDFGVGSERSKLLTSKGMQGGTAPQRIPAGRRHAVDSSDRAICGYEGPLFVYGRGWTSGPGFIRASDRCPECQRLVEERTATAR